MSNANTLRTAILRGRPKGHRPPIDLIEMERELDQAFANAEAKRKLNATIDVEFNCDFDREPRHVAERDFAPTSELSGDELVALMIPVPTSAKLKSMEELDRELSQPKEVDPSYLAYEVRSIY